MYYKYNINKSIHWKGIIDQYSLPHSNDPILQNALVPTIIIPSIQNTARTPFKANPIKAPRKQLIVDVNTTSKRAGVSQIIDRPGGSVSIVKKVNFDLSNCPTLIKEYILNVNSKSNNFSGNKNNCDLDFCYKPRITRNASTIIKKSYSTTNKEYLRKRVRLYNQNQTLSPRADSLSSHEYDSINCYRIQTDPSYCHSKTVTYKPNNKNFSNEGAVSSSLRALNIKYNNIQKTARYSSCPWGEANANNLRYRGSDDAPYTNKSKYNLPSSCSTNLNLSGRQPSGGSGRHTICYTTGAPAIKQQLGSVLQHMIGPGTGLLITPQKGKKG